ncbi:MAG: hypothetical protein Q7K40_01715 [bacterium]|nr:hypothetical protein [bacterium]
MKFLFKIFKKTRAQTVLLSFAIAILVVGVSFSAKTQKAGALLGFGGQILSTTPCTCSEGAALAYVVVGPPAGGEFIQTAETFMYDYTHTVYSPVGMWAGYTWLSTEPPGNWILGSYTKGAAPLCLVTVPDGCFTLPPAIGSIMTAGTSLSSDTGVPVDFVSQ